MFDHSHSEERETRQHNSHAMYSMGALLSAGPVRKHFQSIFHNKDGAEKW